MTRPEEAKNQPDRTANRVIKRYDSRKLYDTEESCYVSMDEIRQWVRAGQNIRVVDNSSGNDVTSQVLTQIILDRGKQGSALSSELLHELVRAGRGALKTSERAWQRGVGRVQGKVDRVLGASLDRLNPLQHVQQEMSDLGARLAELEETLVNLENR